MPGADSAWVHAPAILLTAASFYLLAQDRLSGNWASWLEKGSGRTNRVTLRHTGWRLS